MKIHKLICLTGGLVVLSGCGAKEDEASLPAVPPPAAQAAPVKMGGAVAAVAAPATPPPAPAAAAGQPAPGGSTADKGEYTMVDENGKPVKALELLNLAIDSYERSRAGRSEEDGNGPVPPELTSLDQLVQYRIIARMPAAPAGKKFALDPATHKAAMTSQ